MSVPAKRSEEDEMVDKIVVWIDHIAAAFTSESGRIVLRNALRQNLQAGTIQAMEVITAADAGHADADIVLRQLIAEMIDRREELSTALAGYTQRALLRDLMAYPKGHNLAATWARDIGIAVLVAITLEMWPYLNLTRGRAAKRASACSLVHLALSRRGYPLTEWQVARISNNHRSLAARLAASLR